MIAIAAFAGGAALAQDVQDIRVAFSKWTGHTPIFSGIEKGIYEKYGLNIVPTFYQSGVDNMQGLMAGKQEISAFGTAPTLTAYAKGFDIRIFGMISNFAGIAQYEPSLIVAGKGVAIEKGDIAALKGKKIALTLGTAAEQHLQGLLKKVGLTTKDVEMVNMAPPQQVTALKTGAVDVIIVWNPFGMLAAEQVEGSTIVVEGAGPCENCYDPGFLLTTQDMIDAKGELIEKFYLASAEAMEWVRLNVDEAAEIAARWTEGASLETLKKIIDYEKASFDPRFSKSIWTGFTESSIPFLLESGKIDKAFDPDGLLYPEFYLKNKAAVDAMSADLNAVSADQQIQ